MGKNFSWTCRINRKTEYFLTGGDLLLKQLESFRKMLIERNETMICKCGIGCEGSRGLVKGLMNKPKGHLDTITYNKFLSKKT